jgi:hypothetical protein
MAVESFEIVITNIDFFHAGLLAKRSQFGEPVVQRWPVCGDQGPPLGAEF